MKKGIKSRIRLQEEQDNDARVSYPGMDVMLSGLNISVVNHIMHLCCVVVTKPDRVFEYSQLYYVRVSR